VGESVTRKVDVRILAATNRNLDEALREGIFRDDLFYRLNAVRLKLLPLRNRPEDIPLLIQHFLYKHDPTNSIDIAPESMRLFRLYPWPGNVREIENVIQRAILLAQKGTLEPQHLPEEISRLAESPKPIPSLEEMEKQHIQRVLTQTKDFNEAAQILGIDIATLWRKRKKYGI
jgi:NtrC-family two-component system response regulator AlgB